MISKQIDFKKMDKMFQGIPHLKVSVSKKVFKFSPQRNNKIPVSPIKNVIDLQYCAFNMDSYFSSIILGHTI